jgi:vitamin B12 transporter
MEYGAELNLFDNKLKVSMNATATATKDYSTDRDIVRVPQNEFNINVSFKPIPKLTIGTSVNHVGRYFDIGTDKIKAYTLVDITADYAVTDHFTIYGRMENALSKHYQELRGYGQPGLGAYGGLRAKF